MLSFLPSHPPPLWIADQVCNDGVVVHGCVDSRLRGNDGEGCENNGRDGGYANDGMFRKNLLIAT